MIGNSDDDLKRLHRLFAKQTIATMDELKKTVGTVADLTVFRKLKELDYCTSQLFAPWTFLHAPRARRV